MNSCHMPNAPASALYSYDFKPLSDRGYLRNKDTDHEPADKASELQYTTYLFRKLSKYAIMVYFLHGGRW